MSTSTIPCIAPYYNNRFSESPAADLDTPIYASDGTTILNMPHLVRYDSTTSNRPSGGTGFVSMSQNGQYAAQIALKDGAGSAWVRGKNNGTWGNWDRLITASDLTPTEADGSSTTVTTGTGTQVNKITLSAGTWVVFLDVRFGSNANGYRQGTFSTTSGTTNVNMFISNIVPAVNGTNTHVYWTSIVSPSASTTYYLNAYQNSGSSLATYGHIRAIKIS